MSIILNRFKNLIRAKQTVCLASMAIGDKYLKSYNDNFRSNHESYCRKYNYSFYVITDFIDDRIVDSTVSSLQKALICEMPWAKRYDYVIYIDADTIFTKDAGPIHEVCQGQDKIGIADEYSQPSRLSRIETQRAMGWEDSATQYYKLHGFDIDTSMVLNTGVMILRPDVHLVKMRQIFMEGIEKALNHPRGFHFEQALIGYHLQKTKSFFVLENRWNAVWALQKLNPNNELNLLQFARINQVIHFAGGVDVDQVASIDPYNLANWYE